MKRNVVVAGTFYESDPKKLKKYLKNLLSTSSLTLDEHEKEPLAVMVPHAGYSFCGKVLSDIYQGIKVPNRVIILAPNHTGLGQAVSVSPAACFETPIGNIKNDKEIGRLLVETGPFVWDELAHLQEHAIEVHLPLLLTKNPKVKVTAVCLRTNGFQACEEMGNKLAAVLASISEPVLLIASSDMNHHEPCNVALRKDRMALDRISDIDPRGLFTAVVEHNVSMCGLVPMVVVLVAAKAQGAKHARVVSYCTSGDHNGDMSSVVGYAGVIVSKGAHDGDRPKLVSM
jgi:AmmeMemoRadiSam system protein B